MCALSDLLKTVTNSNKESGDSSFDDLLVLAVETIEQSKNQSIKPRYQTITSFIRGSQKSPFYNVFFVKHSNICGKIPNITSSTVEVSLNELVRQNKLMLKGQDYFSIKNISVVSNDVDSIFMNRTFAKTFDIQTLDALATWDGKHRGTKSEKSITTNDGYAFYYDSKEELSFIKKLSKKSYYVSLRGQSLSIDYCLRGKRIRKYYPDIVMLTHDQKIAIVEVKQLEQMSYYDNIIKYKAMKAYCDNMKFMYVMCDKTFRTFEELKSRRVNMKTKQYFNRIMKLRHQFKMTDYEAYIKNLSTKDKKKVFMDIVSIIIKSDLINHSRFEIEVRNQNTLSMEYMC